MSEYDTSPELHPLDQAATQAELLLEDAIIIESERGFVQLTALATRQKSGMLTTNSTLHKSETPDHPGNPCYMLTMNPRNASEETIFMTWRRGDQVPEAYVSDGTNLFPREADSKLSDKVTDILTRSVAYDPKTQVIVPSFKGKEDRIVTARPFHRVLRMIGILSLY